MDSDAPVVVIGAGIIGASVAYHLSLLNRHVVVIDADVAGSGATRHSFAWIGRSADSVNPAARLRELARQDWHRLGQEVPGLEVNWSGALTWGNFFAHDGAPTTTAVAEFEPHLRQPPAEAQLSADDGWVDPTRASERLVAAAQARGAQTYFGSPVRRLVLDQGSVTGVETDDSSFDAAAVVIAAGTGSSALCASVDVELPLQIAPAVMVRLHAPAGLIAHIVANDEYEIRQAADGSILMPRDYNGETSSDDLRRTGEKVQQLLQHSFSGADDARVISTTIGWRPMPADGEPVVGPSRLTGLYLAVAHPGIALASSLGRLIADELVSGEQSPLLAPYSPSRFTTNSSAA